MKAALLAAVLLSGCAFMQKPVTATVPIAVPCVKVAPSKPPLVSDDELRQMSDSQFVLALGRYYLLAQGYIAELEAVVTACKK